MTKTIAHESDSKTEEHSMPVKRIEKPATWKQIMRNQSKPQHKTPPKPILQHQTKTKNACKNISKAIIQYIQNTDLDQRFGCSKDFLLYIQKNRYIENFQMLSKLLSPSKNPQINDHHCSFRKIYYYFIKTQFSTYIFNSKIKEKSSYLQYRSLFLQMLQSL